MKTLTDNPAAGLIDPRMADFVERYRQAWADRDLERMSELWTENGVAYHPETPEPKRGRAAITAYVSQLLQMAPDLLVTPVRAAANGNTLFIRFRTEATLNGTQLSWEGIDVFEFPDEGPQAAAGVGFYDTSALRDALLGDDPRLASGGDAP